MRPQSAVRFALDLAASSPAVERRPHTPGHLHCPACLDTSQTPMHVQPLSATMSFCEAAQHFVDSHTTLLETQGIRHKADRTLTDYRSQIQMASQFFGAMRLEQIEPYHFPSYQKMRATGEGFTRRMGGRKMGFTARPTQCGPAKINDELELVKRILTEAGAWTPQHAARYRKLQEPDNDIPRALSDAEQLHFLATAMRHSDWHVIWWYSLVARATTFSSDEMYVIRQGDIDFNHHLLRVNPKYGKNSGRRREIPIVDPDCMWALERLVERSRTLVGAGPTHYLFPRRKVRGVYDPFQPTTRHGSLRPLFDAVRDAAGLDWFTINGWRHTAITNLAVQGVPIAVIMSLAGHVSPKMTQHYTHISERVQRRELERVLAAQHPRKPALAAVPARVEQPAWPDDLARAYAAGLVTLPKPKPQAERDAAIYARHSAGATPASLASEYGVGAERIRQICVTGEARARVAGMVAQAARTPLQASSWTGAGAMRWSGAR